MGIVITQKFTYFLHFTRNFAALAITAFVFASLGVFPVRALSDPCQIGETVYSGVIELAPDTYDIFVKLSGVGQLAEVEVATIDTGCRTAPAVTASGDMWQKVDTINTTGGRIQVNLSSDELGDNYEYARPNVMFISKTKPACVPSDECYIDIAGERAVLQPDPSTPDTGTLHVFYVAALEDSAIKEVRYYVDDGFVYKTNELEPFNTQVIPYYSQTITRVVEYTTGQMATIAVSVANSSSGNPWTLLTFSIKKYQTLLFWVAGIVVFMLILHFVRHGIMAATSRQHWLYAHGFIKQQPIQPLTSKQYMHMQRAEWVKRIASGLGTVAFVIGVGTVVVVLLDSYIVRIATVSGSSMERSLHQGQQVFIDKTGVTLSVMNRSDYIPERGQIVAAYLVSRFSPQTEIDENQLVIKRAIGLPGERVVIGGGQVTIYNAQFPDGFNPEDGASWAAKIISDSGNKRLDIKLGNNEVFIMGDNRPSSVDSRINGPLPLKDVIGVIHQ